MNTELILHPSAAYPKPRGRRRSTKPIVAPKPKALTRADLEWFCKARELKVTTKHTKAELASMLATGAYVRPAALDKQNAKRRAEKPAKK